MSGKSVSRRIIPRVWLPSGPRAETFVLVDYRLCRCVRCRLSGRISFMSGSSRLSSLDWTTVAAQAGWMNSVSIVTPLTWLKHCHCSSNTCEEGPCKESSYLKSSKWENVAPKLNSVPSGHPLPTRCPPKFHFRERNFASEGEKHRD